MTAVMKTVANCDSQSKIYTFKISLQLQQSLRRKQKDGKNLQDSSPSMWHCS